MFLDLAEEGRVNYSTVLAGPDGEPMLYLVELIDDYVAVGAIATTYFVEFGKAVAFGKGGHAAIVDHTGRLLAHPLPDWHRSMKDISAVPPVQRMLQGETGISQFYSPAAQADMIAGFTTVPETGWGVMIPQPFAELQNKAAAVRNHALGVILLGLLVAAVVSWFVAGLITAGRLMGHKMERMSE